MKTAIYIENGVVQLVLTPENEFERNALETIRDKPTDTSIKSGAFYHCQGGWDCHGSEDRSLIIRTTTTTP